MRVTIERLRFWLLAMAVLLVAGIAGFLGYSRWRIRGGVSERPAKLNLSVEQATREFTFSKSEGGHTLFTLHAARTIQYKKGGQAELHDVSIVLYSPAGQPVDRIYGNEFAYNPAEGLISAQGAVNIDLESPTASGASAAPGSAASQNAIHVQTTGLTFHQKTGIASTSGPIHFQASGAEGSARGASFDSRKGVLTIEHDLDLKADAHGSPLTVEAGHAVFDRASGQLHLLDAWVDYHGSQSSSKNATVSFRPDGSASQVYAAGNVSMKSGDRRVSGNEATAVLDARNRPQTVSIEGNVRFGSSRKQSEMRGTAGSGIVSFGPRGFVDEAKLRGDVSVLEHQGPGQAGANRQLHADQLDASFTTTTRGSEANTIVARGSASIAIEGAKDKGKTIVQADTLRATLKNGAALENLKGFGSTRMTEIAADGATQTSTGDRLEITFAPKQRGKVSAVKKAPQGSQIRSAEQDGNVVVTERRAGLGSPTTEAGVTTITAARARFEAASQTVHFTGRPRIVEAGSQITAQTIIFNRATGDAQALGDVQAVYTPSGTRQSTGAAGAAPVNVIADHATFNKAKKLTTFYGNASLEARLWQGPDSIAAPIIKLSQAKQQLTASGGRNKVLAILTGPNLKPRPGTSSTAKKGKAEFGGTAQDSIFEVRSASLLYMAADQKAIFRGGVLASSGSGTMAADRMIVYLHSPGKNSPSASKAESSSNFTTIAPGGGEVERIVAHGKVQVKEPGRQATGTELTYTAANSQFALTGTPGNPPRLIDQAHGTLTGESLIFNDHDDSVIVRGGSSRAVIESHVPR